MISKKNNSWNEEILEKWESPRAGGVATESPRAGGVARESPRAGGVAREAPGAGGMAREAPGAGGVARDWGHWWPENWLMVSYQSTHTGGHSALQRNSEMISSLKRFFWHWIMAQINIKYMYVHI